MASHRLITTKDGRQFYELRCKPGGGRPEVTTRWYVPDGWSKRAIDRELAKQKAEFERKCKSGEVLSHKEQKEKARQEAQEAAAIQTVKQYGEAVFMPKKTITLKESTRVFYQTQLDTHIYPVIGSRLLPEITTADINALLLKMQKDGYAHSSVIAVYTTLHQLFKSAYNTDLIERNPMDKVDKPTAPKTVLKNETVKAYTADEVNEILDYLKTEPLKWRALIHLLIYSGMRRGEACGLKWKHIDAKNKTITIAGNLEYSNDYRGRPETVVYYTEKRVMKNGQAKQGAVYYTTPKSGKSRTIDVDETTIKLLRDLRLEESKSGVISEYVFTQDNSPLPMQPQTPTKYMQRLAKRKGIADFHPHKLRHSFATLAITEDEKNIVGVSKKLGHANVATTLRIYTHAGEESMRQASAAFCESLEKARA